MPTTLSPDDALQRAREMQEARLATISALANSNQELADARDRVATAESGYARDYSTAVAAGWTAAELSKIGFAEAAKAPRVRRQSRRPASSDEGSASE
jgi:hypothetical protein